jgi:hypothetical protein
MIKLLEDSLKYLLLIICFTFLACGPQKTQSKKSFPSVSELISEEGSPESISENEIDMKSEMYNYGTTSYQVKDNQVHVKFKKPEDNEKSIQFWRHKFKDDKFEISVYEETEHTKNFKLINKSKGITLVFDESGRVLRVAKDLEVKGE